MRIESKICPTCKEKNNPSFSDCWKCKISLIDIKLVLELFEAALVILEANDHETAAKFYRPRLDEIKNAASHEEKVRLTKALKDLFGGMCSFQDFYFATPKEDGEYTEYIPSLEQARDNERYNAILDRLYEAITGVVTPKDAPLHARIAQTFRGYKSEKKNV